MTRKKSGIGGDILRRVRYLYAVFLIAGVAIVARLLWVQYGPEADELRSKAMEITFERRSIPAQRGDILARDGRILATTVPEYGIRMDFASIINMQDTAFVRMAGILADSLSRFFGDKPKKAYEEMLDEGWKDKYNNRYKRIGNRRVNYEEQKRISKFPVFSMGRYRGGYIAEPVNRRFSPMGTMARKAVGYASSDTIARDGVESGFNSQLRGVYGNSLMQKISGTFWVPVSDPLNVEPVNGMDVVTTLDVDIQDVAETALKKQLEEGGAMWGTVILMEVSTGEIRVMCNITRERAGVYAEDRNYAMESRSEPGSTFKLATLMTLLEDGGMSLGDMVDCSSDAMHRTLVGRVPVTDDHKEGVIPLKRVFEISSNIGFSRSVYNRYRDNPARFVEFVRDTLRFGYRTGIDLPNELAPVVKHPSEKGRWDYMTLQKMAYGYAFEITPLQTVTFYNAVANNGRMMKPMIVKEIRSYGKTVEKFDPVVLNPAICSERTLRSVRECLEGVVDEGTGRFLRNPYYRAAAKTGTAQAVQEHGGYGTPGNRDYLSSFVGYFPADNPQYTCIVVIKTRQQPGKSYYGAALAGPVFKAIADRVYASSTFLHSAEYPPYRSLPAQEDIKGGRADRVRTVAEAFSLPYGMDGGHDGWWSPAAMYAHAGAGTDSAAHATEDEGYTYDGEGGGVVVPDVGGMPLRDALYLLETTGFKVDFRGKGRVVSQSLTAGTAVEKGRNIFLVLEI